jgi:hypothetical protein
VNDEWVGVVGAELVVIGDGPPVKELGLIDDEDALIINMRPQYPQPGAKLHEGDGTPVLVSLHP